MRSVLTILAAGLAALVLLAAAPRRPAPAAALATGHRDGGTALADGGTARRGGAGVRVITGKTRGKARTARTAARASARSTDGGTTDGGAPAGETEATRRLSQRIDALAARVSALEEKQASLESSLTDARTRLAAVEQSVQSSAARRAARTPRFDRVALLSGILDDLGSVEHSLSEGDADVTDTLNRDAAGFSQDADEAARLGHSLEADHARAARAAIDSALAALGQSDLYTARVEIGGAIIHGRRALGLARTATAAP